jgi:hypothetical protein
MLELPRLVDQVEAMGEEIARRRADYDRLVARARRALADFDRVDEALLARIQRAKRLDQPGGGPVPWTTASTPASSPSFRPKMPPSSAWTARRFTPTATASPSII